MKTNAIIRIIACTLGIVILSGLLIAGLGLDMFSFNGTFRESTVDHQSTGSDCITADPGKIRELEIEWAAGTIRIEPSENTTTIQVKESEVADKYKMVCKVSGDTLSIKFSKESLKFPSFGVDNVSKDLVLSVPAGWGCHSLELDVAAADVEIRDMTIGQLDFDGASGRLDLIDCTVSEMDVDVASGDLSFSGSLNSLDFDGASADCKLTLTNCPRHIDLDGMSGELDITLPSTCGFTAKTDGLSFDFSTDFQTTMGSGSHIHGDGSCLIEIAALSGHVNIRDGGYNCSCGHS